jgi:hypothetical protein
MKITFFKPRNNDAGFFSIGLVSTPLIHVSKLGNCGRPATWKISAIPRNYPVAFTDAMPLPINHFF